MSEPQATHPQPAVEPAPTDDRSVLVISQLWNETKIERHWEPLADVAGDVTMVCVDDHPGIDSIRFRTVPSPGHRLVGILAMFVVAFRECLRDDYDAVVSISLFPYGCYALALGTVFGLPSHLGIIGIDLDHHATAWYGRPVRWLFRRFTSVSVPGTVHQQRLVGMGVDPARASVLVNAIDTDRYRPSVRPADPAYDFVWVGRFYDAKDPLLFVRALAVLRERGHTFDAVMVGDGPLHPVVERECEALGLDSSVSLAGWCDDPLVYYAQGSVYTLTSARDALPLTLLEAMATGAPAVTPNVGSVSDPVTHGQTGYVVDERTPEAIADAMQTLAEDDRLRDRLGRNASAVREAYSYEVARENWQTIMSAMCN